MSLAGTPRLSVLHGRRPTDMRTPLLLVLTGAVAVVILLNSTRPTPVGHLNRMTVHLNLEADPAAAVEEVATAQQLQEAASAVSAAKAAGAPLLEEALQKQQQAQVQLQAAQQQQAQAGSNATQQTEAGTSSTPVDPLKAFRDFKHAVQACKNFTCLQEANKDPAPSQFRFPHFYLIGFQKCATTSLFHHLIDHPQIMPPSNKEPEFFTKTCEYNAIRCHHSRQLKYMKEVLNFEAAAKANFTRAAFEGSTHYALEGDWLAMQLIDLFPWIKVVLSMRDPISQAISMLNHGLEHKRIPDCFSVDGQGKYVYPCIVADLDEESRYATSLTPWIKYFPREQLHVIQYENITGDGMVPALRDVKRYLGIDETLPSDDLGLFNYRHQRRHKDGWPMLRREYLELVEKARRNTAEVVAIVRQYGFADADKWQKNWEAAWQKNLNENCEPLLDGKCMIQVT